MEIKNLPAYQNIAQKFKTGEFQLGTKSSLPIYSYVEGMQSNLTSCHYVDGIKYSKISFNDVPEEFRTRDFFLHSLSDVHKDVLAYVKSHLGEEFDRDFFKDHIATDMYALEFEENCFEYMPLEYIDEEMVSCAMLTAVSNRYVERRGDFDDWFYSVAKRKPELLTQDFWTLGARLFAKRINGKNKFLDITPEEYKTKEYYLYMCLENNTPVIEDIPENILTDSFLILLANININNIKSFNEKALERKVPISGQEDKLKFWQVALLINGYLANSIPLNDERIEFFLNHYDVDSPEYRYGFRDAYKRYLRNKELSKLSC